MVKKITSSMKTASASKLRKAEQRKDIAVPYYQAASNFANQLLQKEEDPEKKGLLVVLTSDRGLCGSTNSGISRAAKAKLQAYGNKYEEVVVLGSKGKSALQRLFGERFIATMTDLDRKPIAFGDVVPLAEYIVSRNFDQLTILSNKFVNVISFVPQQRTFTNFTEFQKDYFSHVDLTGEKREILQSLYEYNVATLIYSSIVENQAVELAARMASMENATKNATDMIARLTLEYNKKRQAGITTELVEIISGAESIKQQDD
jgi:ATP synthase F1 gamma subunit